MLAQDLIFFKKIDADMLGIGPFIPCENTPLEREKGGNVEIVLKMLALSRLLLPDINIPATTALAVKDKAGYIKGLKCGANVIMPNIGIDEYKNLYKLYPGKVPDNPSEAVNSLENIKKLILSQNRTIGKDKGYRKKILNNNRSFLYKNFLE
ncbi:Biotin and Thiamin Synthesis associated domain-containing protein [Thermoanaerobacter thermohydrosulfuricus]|uniref:Biotin and Thiamin Synthesis associated domain-containing protein n=1 Tax=Thermoanaerobacter thermohydrosulfuricus TaxID=1516 RepID=A0A1G7RJZ9_THETY|nr:biotin and thiamin synthesis associated [Thermoanaerobacter ethanolicus JW 200]SDG11023.1 Biotin and Thiamin Synthesis associated domain-containing protein [Thermoanaerobacter thermohydrosulfuricus]